MASGADSGAAEQPLALPVKQRRSRSSGSSSVDSNWFAPSGAADGEQGGDASNDVFHEPADPTDCQARFCPVHRRHGPSRHQVRFFSDLTPPPVPKKKMARTLSLPADAPPPFSPPLARLHVPNAFFPDETPPNSVPSLSQLSFDTPDEQLPHFFRGLEDQGVVFQGIQHRQILFLQSVARSIDAGLLLPEGGEHPYRPRDFLLGEESTQVGGTVFYSLRSPKLPERRLALRVHKRTDQRPPPSPKSQHCNVQHTLAYFQAPTEADSSPSKERNPACSATLPPADGSRGAYNRDATSVDALLAGGRSVSVERERPDLTLEEFVERSGSRGDYHRQLCLLLLQILTGSQHLYATSGRAAALGPAEVMLVWPPGDEGPSADRADGSGSPRRRGSPRVVLSPDWSSGCGSRALGLVKARLGALVRFCLGPQERLTSSYQHGLLQLASALQDEGGSGLQVGDAAATLQVLLWGPRQSLLERGSPVSSAVHNWLSTKRALLVLKLAERGLVQERCPLDWEDSLCLQYLSSTDSQVVARAVARLWPPLHLD